MGVIPWARQRVTSQLHRASLYCFVIDKKNARQEIVLPYNSIINPLTPDNVDIWLFWHHAESTFQVLLANPWTLLLLLLLLSSRHVKGPCQPFVFSRTTRRTIRSPLCLLTKIKCSLNTFSTEIIKIPVQSSFIPLNFVPISL